VRLILPVTSEVAGSSPAHPAIIPECGTLRRARRTLEAERLVCSC
jgi:hypothetical protein